MKLQANTKINISYTIKYFDKTLFLRYTTNCDKYFFYNEKTTFETKTNNLQNVAKIVSTKLCSAMHNNQQCNQNCVEPSFFRQIAAASVTKSVEGTVHSNTQQAV